MLKLWQLVLIGVLLAACNNNGARTRIDAAGSGPPDGQQLYNANGCLGCHPVEPDAGYAAGPPLVGISEQVEAVLNDPAYDGEAETFEAYIRESIVDPNIYITEGYEPIMPTTHQMTLSEAQIEAIVDYIVALN